MASADLYSPLSPHAESLLPSYPVSRSSLEDSEPLLDPFSLPDPAQDPHQSNPASSTTLVEPTTPSNPFSPAESDSDTAAIPGTGAGTSKFGPGSKYGFRNEEAYLDALRAWAEDKKYLALGDGSLSLDGVGKGKGKEAGYISQGSGHEHARDRSDSYRGPRAHYSAFRGEESVTGDEDRTGDLWSSQGCDTRSKRASWVGGASKRGVGLGRGIGRRIADVTSKRMSRRLSGMDMDREEGDFQGYGGASDRVAEWRKSPERVPVVEDEGAVREVRTPGRRSSLGNWLRRRKTTGEVAF